MVLKSRIELFAAVCFFENRAEVSTLNKGACLNRLLLPGVAVIPAKKFIQGSNWVFNRHRREGNAASRTA